MNIFKIIIEDDFKVYSNTIDSTFYITNNNYYFPCENWTDFVYPVLYEWTYTVLRYYNSDDVNFTLYFMDGSYYLLCSKKKENVELQCFFNNKRQQAFDVKYIDLVKELKNAIGKFFKYTEYISIDNNIYEHFRMLLNKIKNILLYLE